MLDKRNINIDLIRVLAIFCVISVHFFYNNGFYETPVVGMKMYLMVGMRTLFMICVPLFMMISGYLMSVKVLLPLQKSYYLHLMKVIGPYVIITLFILIFRIFFLNHHLTLSDVFLNIFGYKQYAWYVNMYIGLYLLLPFLNTMWQHLPTHKEQTIFVVTLLVLTMLPSLFNIYDFETPGWFLMPGRSHAYDTLVPNWWSDLYPLTYYFIGAYIHKYKATFLKIKPRHYLIMLMSSLLLFTIYNCYRSHDVPFVIGEWCEWGGFENIIDAGLIFLFLIGLNVKRLGMRSRYVLQHIANLVFGTYMASWIMDQIVYPILKHNIPMMDDRLYYFIPCIVLVFIGSYLLAFLANQIYQHTIAPYIKTSS